MNSNSHGGATEGGNGRLSREYFDLVRDALKEERKSKRPDRPLKRRKTQKPEVITIDSSSEEEPNANANVDDDGGDDFEFDEDEDYDSEEFEDVTTTTTAAEKDGDISITIDARTAEKPQKKGGKRKSGNGVDAKLKEYRKTFHMFVLMTYMCHSFIRNKWCNDEKLQKKLSKLVPDEIFNNLHPPKDEQMPARSTRKLLDALRMAMQLWNKKFSVQLTSPYEYTHLYMVRWDSVVKHECKPVSFKQFKKFFSKMRGPCNISVQGFVTMMRGCGLNARLLHNIQPPDFTDAKKYEKRVSWRLENECLKYPIYWCEVWDKFAKQWITIDVVGQEIIEQVRTKSKLEAIGRKNLEFNMMRYVISYDRKLGCKDVSRRYISHLQNKVRKKRITRDPGLRDWYSQVINTLNKRSRNRTDDYEDEYFALRDEQEGIPDNLQDMKNHPFYVLEKDLRANQVLKPNAQHCGFLRLRNKENSLLKVYSRKDVISCYSARHWYMQGRVLKTGAKHLLTHRVKAAMPDEDEEEERLYPIDQTEYFIPKQVGEDSKIPTNAYGNIDVYKPWMIPIGCCLVENPNSIKAASFLRVPFAKAVTGFKFESGRRVKPKITGVVVENEYVDALIAVIDHIEEYNADVARHELEIEALNGWSLLLTKLRIKSRLVDQHGVVQDEEEEEQIAHQNSNTSSTSASDEEETQFEAGGFLLDSTAEPGGFLPEPEDAPEPEPEPEPETNYRPEPDAGHTTSEHESTQHPNESVNNIEDYEQFLQEVGSDYESEDAGDDSSFEYESE